MKEALESTFQYEVDEYLILEKLRRDRPEKDESLIQYMHRMRRLASLAGLSEKLTVKYIVNGISGNAFEKLELRACKSFDELKDAMAVYEAARREEIDERRRASKSSTCNLFNWSYSSEASPDIFVRSVLLFAVLTGVVVNLPIAYFAKLILWLSLNVFA